MGVGDVYSSAINQYTKRYTRSTGFQRQRNSYLLTMDEFRLKWQTHVSSLCQEFVELLQNERHVDVTLFCRNGSVKAHRLLLSSSSPFLQTILASTSGPEATILIPDIDITVLRALVEYIYHGEISVQDTDIQALISAATLLEIRGIALAAPQLQLDKGMSMHAGIPYPMYPSSPSPVASSPLPLASSPVHPPQQNGRKSAGKPRKPRSQNGAARHLFADSEREQRPLLSKQELGKRTILPKNCGRARQEDLSEKRRSPHEEDAAGPGAEESVKRSRSEEQRYQLNVADWETRENNALNNGGGPASLCSSPLYIDTCGSQQEDALPPVKKVEDESADAKVHAEDSGASSLNSSMISEPDASIFNPQVEMSEGDAGVQVKTEPPSYDDAEELAALALSQPLSSGSGTPPASPASFSFCASSTLLGDDSSSVDMSALGACVFCKKHFSSSDQLREHISRVHVTDRLEKQFKCDYCPAAFARSAHLKRHVRTHTGEKPYACPVCPRAFSRQDKLKCHMDRHAGGDSNRRSAVANSTVDDGSVAALNSSPEIRSYLRELHSDSAAPISPDPVDEEAPPTTASTPSASLDRISKHSKNTSLSSNPSLPYLQHILDDVQIVRDKKPASYYRNMKRLSSESLLHTVRRLGECTIKLAAQVE